MTRLIAVASGKGGVGKTTLVANLGSVLAEMGKDVIILDANLTAPNLGMHLGIPLFPTTLHDVLKNNADISDAIYRNKKNKLKIIPAGISINDLRGADARDLPNALLDLLGNTDIVLVDAAAGLGREALAAIESCDELLVITTPDMPAVTDGLKAVKLAQQAGTKVHGIVVNRVGDEKHELNDQELQDMFEAIKIIGKIPEDKLVSESISKKTPLVQYKPYAKTSRVMKQIASQLVGQDYIPKKPWHKRLFGFLFK